MRIPRLFTVGYEGRTSANLIERLQEANVDRVVDVRELPLSKHSPTLLTSIAPMSAGSSAVCATRAS